MVIRRILIFVVVTVAVAIQVYVFLSLLTAVVVPNSEWEEIVQQLMPLVTTNHVNGGGGGSMARNAGSNANADTKKAHFRDFVSNPKHHNRTVTGEAIPGSFLEDRLFLIGARLTTSYVPNKTQVHVDVFGFPGDMNKHWHCDNSTFAREWNFLPMKDFAVVHHGDDTSRAALYCQLECTTTGSTNKRGQQASEPTTNCGPPIRMRWIRSMSGDGNQDGSTLIWRCNVTEFLSKPNLLQAAAAAAAAGRQSSVRVRLLLRYNNYNEDQTEELDQRIIDASWYTMHNVTQLDIPLQTGVVGHGGPHIRQPDRGYFSPQQQAEPLKVGLCLTLYGRNATRYVPEFVQHHLNNGISHIVIGMETNMDSEELNLAEQLLRPYIDTGFVVLQATGLSDYFTCHTELLRLHFYHQCLYYFKGLSEYSAAWDLDEYWLPSARLEVSGTSTFAHQHQGGGENVDAFVSDTSGAATQTRFIERSDASAFSPLATSDPLWQESNYSKSISIWDAIKAIDQFHTMHHPHHDCGEKWCYALFPSAKVYRRRPTVMQQEKRTHRMRDDFGMRDVNASGDCWKKAITRTQIAMANGIHLPGSCQFPNDPNLYAFGQHPECYPHLWESGEFGVMHHFQSLMLERDHVGRSENVMKDEYVEMFADTVSKQLDRHNVSVIAATQVT